MQLLIDQSNITRTSLGQDQAGDLQTGQVRVKLLRCALTANNVTYAAAGFVIGYWKFFPSGVEGQGLLPVWGTAEVTESACHDVPTGMRLYGFWPLADTTVLQPERDKHGVLTDRAAHRTDLPAIYNRYTEVKPANDREDDLRALLQPLLATSYLLRDFLEDKAFFGASQVIIGSASSKTGLGLCKFLAELSPRPVKIVGLTSSGNVDFVQGLGACDSVVSYDDVETLERVPSVFVDMAGNAQTKQRLHAHLADHLTHSAAVGTSHWDKFQPQIKLDGPKPEFFFAPSHVAKRREDWGPGVIERQITDGWKRLATDASSWLDVNVHTGFEQAQAIYDDIATGRAAPRDGHIIALN
ncbi:MAG: DUF2855 family protein [Aliishimia sp.]